MLSLRNFDIKFIKGIGPARAELLQKELGLRSAYDLLHHYPTSYVDRSKIYSIRSLLSAGQELPYLQVKGRFVSFNTLGEGAKMRLVGLFSDGTATMEVTWFRGIKNIRSSLSPQKEYILFGKPGTFNGRLQMTHPEVDSPDSAAATQGMRGVYPLTERLRQRNFGSRQIFTAIQNLLTSRTTPFSDTLPAEVVRSQGLMPLDAAIRAIHLPPDPQTLQQARFRLKFEELFYIQTDILMRSQKRKAQIAGHPMPRVGYWFNTFYKECLPFELTGAQKRVIKEIRADIMGNRQMNRLVQGDVGCGKTLVALMCMLLAIDNGYQACLMAPTEILATQHYQTIRDLAAKIGLNVKLLTGSTRAKERAEIHRQLTEGTLHLLVGTHAVIEDTVQFRNLGFVVIDEQHRFGVAQRASLSEKGEGCDVLVMSATPIPRTLSLIFYGDLDISVIKDKPSNRLEITTAIIPERKYSDMYRYVEEQAKLGNRAYFVCPKIEGDEEGTVMSVTELFEELKVKMPSVRVALLHGKMKDAEKTAVVSAFKSGEYDCLVSTTVIEVGVDVPEATTMIIYNAERFGLAQLHQLRGRVGRGDRKSYCFLLCGVDTDEARARLSVIVNNSDGFKIADEDLKLRGGGDFMGTRQSGKMLNDIKNLKYPVEAVFTAKAISDEAFSGRFDVKLLTRIAAEKYESLKDITLN